ncbi:endonuclease/exonuclease/phosphatase family protein [Diaminobutyricibacter sp. McL0608]|uniref:endonuclease/exonuclease/phosphatase family protein n=1 Tax=Leifsonia sp. McL0608 TaxID=3143537 RepID=UPI0031F30B4F
MRRNEGVAGERPRRSARSGWWWAAGIVVVVAVVLGFADILGIARAPIVAGVLAPRNAVTVATGVGALIALVVTSVPSVRRIALPFAAALAVATAISAPIVLARGVVEGRPAALAGAQVRMLSWNINGDLVSAETIAAEAASVHANVVVLPDISTAERPSLVEAFARHHITMAPEKVRGDEVMVLTDAALRRSDVTSVGSPAHSATLALHPSDPGQPTLLALHAPQPTLRGNADWRAELAWVTDQCSKGDTIVAGDFNATLDELGESGLGGCRDAAASAHAASVGSWPTAVPTWLAMPIDHIFVTPDWKVDSFTVLTDQDSSGARHRPVLAVLTRR